MVWALVVVSASAAVGTVPELIQKVHTPTARFELYVVALALSIVGAVWLDVRRGGDLFSPLALTGAFYFLAFVAGALFFWLAPRFWFVTHYSASAAPALDHRAVATATGLCLIGWVGFAAGYELRIFRFLHLPPLRLDITDRDPTRAMWMLWGLGWVVRAIRLSQGVYYHSGVSTSSTFDSGGTSNQVLSIGVFLPLLAVAYAGVLASRTGDLRWRRLYRGGLLVEFAYAVPSGTRGVVGYVVVAALAISYYARGRLPWRAIVVGGAILFLAFPIMYLERSPASSNQTTGTIGKAAVLYFNQPASSILSYAAGTVLSRFSDITIPAALVERGDIKLGAPRSLTVAWFFTAPIPRALWPGKPDSSAFGGEVPYELGLEPTAGVPIATTQVGEMYLDFGTGLGVLLGLLFVGGMNRELGEWLRHRRDHPVVTALYATLALGILGTPEKIVSQGFSGIVRAAVVLAVILWAAIALSRTRVGRVVVPDGLLRIAGAPGTDAR